MILDPFALNAKMDIFWMDLFVLDRPFFSIEQI